jgi:hypothetical protein
MPELLNVVRPWLPLLWAFVGVALFVETVFLFALISELRRLRKAVQALADASKPYPPKRAVPFD